MSVTFQQIASDAMSDIGFLWQGQTGNDDVLQGCLRQANIMLDQFALIRQFIYTKTADTPTWNVVAAFPSLTSYTAGTVTTNGTTAIVGSSTTFDQTLVGAPFTIGNSSSIVASVTDATHLTLTTAIGGSASGLAYSVAYTFAPGNYRLIRAGLGMAIAPMLKLYFKIPEPMLAQVTQDATAALAALKGIGIPGVV